MIKRLLGIYDWLSGHKGVLWTSLAVLTSVFAALILRLGYSEDISDFLPLGTSDREALSVYQNISGADRIFIMFSNPGDEDLTIEAMDRFGDIVEQNDNEGWCSSLQVAVDMDQVQQVADFVYDNIPYFLTDADYARMDSLLMRPGYVRQRLQEDVQLLMFPTGGMVEGTVMKDPLGLYGPVLMKLQAFNPQMSFEMVDGHIFTPDMSRAVAMMTSPFGNSETSCNARLVKLLDGAIAQMEAEYPSVHAHVVGGPAIAVGNSSCIKRDSIIAVALSAVLIVLLLVYSFNSFRNILLILLSISWGWLFALGGMSLFSSQVSIIVIGISSVILGIAVNYPLHLIAHLGHDSDIRRVLKDITVPLVVGNITTVGAFLALVPLQSTALRDLGTFAALLLVGTILFVLLYLPHFVKVKPQKERKARSLAKVAELSPDRSKAVVAAVALITLVLGYFSLGTEFDDNLSNINYMSSEQRQDMSYFQSLLDGAASSTAVAAYVLSSGSDYDDALVQNERNAAIVDSLRSAGLVLSDKGPAPFVCSQALQQRRLDKFRDFVGRHERCFGPELAAEASRAGFAEGSFEPFTKVLQRLAVMNPQPIEYFEPLVSTVFASNFTTLEESGRSYAVDVLSVEPENLGRVEAAFDHCFDVKSMNSALSRNLSDNFNYIGWACSLIVFFFLWFSFGRIELALISFLPMAVSWVWILGIMSVFGIKFNIVNVILATFIFGQGDDYTIFMTEGCQYEYAYRQKILHSYKSSIIQSALIMFVGIGTLIVARHPAMRSLAEVTIIGMFSVVFMAWLIPPFLFRWMTTRGGRPRQYPLTLGSLFFGVPRDPVTRVLGRYIYKGSEITRHVRRSLSKEDINLISMDLGGAKEYEFSEDGYGEKALLLALTHPSVRIICRIENSDHRTVARVAADGFVKNIEFTE